MWSVEVGYPPEVWDVVVRRPFYERRRMVHLVRGIDPKQKMPLCQVMPSHASPWMSGWIVIVEGQELDGPRMVEGLVSIRACVTYAFQVRPDINLRAKVSHHYPLDCRFPRYEYDSYAFKNARRLGVMADYDRELYAKLAARES